jgi:hypothetical protein
MKRGIAVGTLLLCACAHSLPQSGSGPPAQRGKGRFDVKVVPTPGDDASSRPTFARLTFDKQFHGDLDGTSSGQMLAWGTGEKSGAYVALELVTGTLAGRRGTFVLEHKGEMVGGVPDMLVTVAPGSGTDELAGLSGKMSIHIDGRDHSYDFEYRLPPAR